MTYFIVLAAVISREAGDGTRLGDQAFKVFIKHEKGERLGSEFAVDLTAIGINIDILISKPTTETLDGEVSQLQRSFVRKFVESYTSLLVTVWRVCGYAHL